jgi:hypothetical protein
VWTIPPCFRGFPRGLVYRSDGTSYFWDPYGGLRGGPKSPHRELDFSGLFMLKDGKLQVVDKNPEEDIPNGMNFSPDEKNLYGSAGLKMVRYEVRPDGTLANPHARATSRAGLHEMELRRRYLRSTRSRRTRNGTRESRQIQGG